MYKSRSSEWGVARVPLLPAPLSSPIRLSAGLRRTKCSCFLATLRKLWKYSAFQSSKGAHRSFLSVHILEYILSTGYCGGFWRVIFLAGCCVTNNSESPSRGSRRRLRLLKARSWCIKLRTIETDHLLIHLQVLSLHRETTTTPIILTSIRFECTSQRNNSDPSVHRSLSVR